MRRIGRVIGAHLYPDPVAAILADVALVLLVVFGVLLITYQVTHHGRYP